MSCAMGRRLKYMLEAFCFSNRLFQCKAGMHAPPRPAPALGEMAAPGRPGPENFQLCPAPEKEGAAPPRKLPRGKYLGKRSYIIKSFWEFFDFQKLLTSILN